MPQVSAALPELVEVPGQPVRLQSTYHDTADLRLARWGCSLRFDSEAGWRVSLPLPEDHTLVESELTFPGTEARPPREAVNLVRAYIRHAMLLPVARLRVIRRPIELRSEERGLVATILDDEVSVLDGRRLAARFRELELVSEETIDDDTQAILDRLLRAAGAGNADTTPRHVRAIGPRALEPPEVEPVAVGRHSGATQLVRAAISGSVIQVLRYDAGVRLGEEPEAVHQARVATRRLRSDLRTFAPLVDPPWAENLREQLAWLAGLLGVVRDAEVMRIRLQQLAAELPEADAAGAAILVGELEQARLDGRKRLLTEMEGARYLDLLDQLVEAAQTPHTTPLAEQPAVAVAATLLEHPWRGLRSAVRRLPDQPSDPDLHALRIRAKRLRYAAEASASVLGRPASRLARAAAQLQTVLGDHQDACVAQDWLRAAATRHPEAAFVAGEMSGLEHARAEQARSRWRAAWKALDRIRAKMS